MCSPTNAFAEAHAHLDVCVRMNVCVRVYVCVCVCVCVSFLPYCDGSSFLSDRSAPVVVNGTGFLFLFLFLFSFLFLFYFYFYFYFFSPTFSLFSPCFIHACAILFYALVCGC
jgi:hypothetical protein